MTRKKKAYFGIFVLCSGIPFLLCACSNLPLIGKKKQPDNVPTDKTVTVEEMEQVKGVNPPKSDAQAPSKKPSVPAVATPLPKAARLRLTTHSSMLNLRKRSRLPTLPPPFPIQQPRAPTSSPISTKTSCSRKSRPRPR